VLAADAVEKVGNGHPGTAISLAPVAYLLFNKVMRHDPKDDRWIGRDRFILSVGHSSLTIYNQLFLHGYGLELEDLKALRTWGSATPGHPEYGHTKGVEITTGPLGQGLASATGFAYAARFERGLFDPETAQGASPFDHFVYVIAGDGDMQEGVTSEAASLAGHQQLGNLVVIYDSNQISIEDDTNISFTENIIDRYESYGWHTQTVDWKKTGKPIELGNMDAKRDWGHAQDYVEAMWLMLQQPDPEDFVIATGETHSIREFIVFACDELGVATRWTGTGVDETCVDVATGQTIIKVNPEFYRPAEVDMLIGDARKAQDQLGWRRKISFRELVKRMVANDCK
jgi:transketolase N-terminal domain/subunit